MVARVSKRKALNGLTKTSTPDLWGRKQIKAINHRGQRGRWSFSRCHTAPESPLLTFQGRYPFGWRFRSSRVVCLSVIGGELHWDPPLLDGFIRAFRDTGRQGGGKSTAPWGASWIASLCQCDRFIQMARPAFMTSISIVPPITSPFENFCSCVSADGNGSAKRPMLKTRGVGGKSGTQGHWNVAPTTLNHCATPMAYCRGVC